MGQLSLSNDIVNEKKREKEYTHVLGFLYCIGLPLFYLTLLGQEKGFKQKMNKTYVWETGRKDAH